MLSGIEIGNLPGTAGSQLTDVIPANQNNNTVQESLSQLLTLFLANLNSGAALTDGQIIIGSTGNPPVGSVITAGSNISIANGPGSIQISGTATPGIGWTFVTSTAQTMTADAGYVANNGSLVSLTLPVLAAFGTVIYIQGLGAGGWIVVQNAGQNVIIGSVSSLAGVTGSVASTNRYNSVALLCVVANTTWAALSGPQGNLSIVTA